MDTAVFRRHRLDKGEIIDAYSCSYQYENRLYCPLCGEPVSYVEGQYVRSHFRHKKNSAIAQECDNYAQNNSYWGSRSFIQHKTGLAFFLNKIGGVFCLYLVLPGIDSNILNELKSSNEPIKIITHDNRKQVTSVQITDIHADKDCYVPITKLSDSYSIEPPISLHALDRLWGYETRGIFSEGTFFRIGKAYGSSRRIRFNGAVYPSFKYYFVIRRSQLRGWVHSILNIEEITPLNTEPASDWVVCTVSFKEFTDKGDRAYEFCHDRQVNLTELPAENLPLWPPMPLKTTFNQTTDEVEQTLCLSKPGIVYYLVENLNDQNQVVEYEKIKISNTMIIPPSNHTSTIDTTIELNEKNIIPPYQLPKCDIRFGQRNIPYDDKITIKLEKKNNTSLKIDSYKVKCHVSHSRDGYLRTIFMLTPKKGCSIDDVKRRDKIAIYHGKDCLSEISFLRKSNDSTQGAGILMTDAKLFELLTDKNDNYITFPIQLKHAISKLSPYQKSFMIINQNLKTGKITKKAVEFIKINHLAEVNKYDY